MEMNREAERRMSETRHKFLEAFSLDEWCELVGDVAMWAGELSEAKIDDLRREAAVYPASREMLRHSRAKLIEGIIYDFYCEEM